MPLMRVTFRLAALCAMALCSLLLPGAAGGAFPGTNGRIAFVTDRDGVPDIYTSNPDGSDPVNLTQTRVAEADPAYSPDGMKIAFSRSDDIWVMNADGTGAVAITGTEGSGEVNPAWSRDGTKIVFVSNRSTPSGGTTGPELWVMDAGGANVRQLTDTTGAGSGAPAWSPTADQVAFHSNVDGENEIYTIDANSTPGAGTDSRVKRTNNTVQDQNPSWSPSGARIAFERGNGTAVGDTTKEIWTMNADGSDPVQVTKNSFYDVEPAYSPDGTRIAFESNGGQGSDTDREIQTVAPVPGALATNITNNATNITDGEPDWAPVPGVPPPPGGGPGPGGGPPLRLADLDNPTLGVDVNVEPASGIVLVGIPGGAARAAASGQAAQKGVTFVPLTQAQQIPVGSFLNTRRGTVRMESAANRAGKRQRGNFARGIFQVRQSKKRRLRGLTDLVMKGASFRGCRAAGGRRASASLSRRAIRRLRSNARGRFRTSGRNSSATVRGTKWEVIDRCDGTLTKVSRGRVVVRDFRRKRNVLVRAGKSYLAKARR
jgi:Tol biopolymer transport system component